MKPLDKIKMKEQSGFTLTELMVTIVLIGMVIGLAGIFFNFSFLSEKKVEDEYSLQASMRQASEVLNNSIRKSTVTFTLTEDVFDEAKKNKWNYFGVEDGKKIVQYTWNESAATHDKKVLLTAPEGMSYNLYFSQNTPNSKLIQFNLECIKEGDTGKKIAVETELSAMNSIAVDDGGSVDNPAAAIAYRSDPAPTPEVITTNEEVTIAIALVLDKSGSMADNMNGGSVTGSRPSRVSIMKNQANHLIDQFATQNIVASIIPYANTANYPGDMLNCKVTGNVTQLKHNINNISADGGTNTGDGLRRAYYKLKTYNTANPGKEIVNYIILLTDGNPTYRSSRSRSGDAMLTADGNCSYIDGTGSESSSNMNYCMDYVETIGGMIASDPAIPVRTFVIGFSGVSSDVSRAHEIAAYCTGTGDNRKGTYFEANSEIALESTLRSITTTILNETWHIYGPY